MPCNCKSLLCLILMQLIALGCQLEEKEKSPIRGHSVVKAGVFHAPGLDHGARYCQKCHGTTLAGGELGEPSCYQCHGINWSDDPPDKVHAPADHTALNDRFYHHPDYLNPTGTCAVAACHGSELTGDQSVGTPSCFVCHEQLWP